MAALERGADVTVAGAAAPRTVEVTEGHVADRKMQPVEPAEHAGERMCRVLVDHELPGMHLSVKPSVGDRKEPQVGARNRTPPMPKATRLELRLNRRWQGLDGRLKRRRAQQQRR